MLQLVTHLLLVNLRVPCPKCPDRSWNILVPTYDIMWHHDNRTDIIQRLDLCLLAIMDEYPGFRKLFESQRSREVRTHIITSLKLLRRRIAYVNDGPQCFSA
jgi:hypothetical protein